VDAFVGGYLDEHEVGAYARRHDDEGFDFGDFYILVSPQSDSRLQIVTKLANPGN
jgi:hypothetical protein